MRLAQEHMMKSFLLHALLPSPIMSHDCGKESLPNFIPLFHVINGLLCFLPSLLPVCKYEGGQWYVM